MEINNLFNQIGEMRLALTEHIEEEMVRDAQQATKLDGLILKMESLEKNVKALLDLWEQGKGMLTLVKWCAAIAGFGISIITFLKAR